MEPVRTDQDLAGLSRRVRASVVRMAYAGRTPHVGSALSCVDVLTALYGDVLRVDPRNPGDPARDRFILSKGHGCMALYAVLAECGFFPASVLDEYARDGGRLPEHPSPGAVPGIDVATGSLGHGLPVGAGLALAAKRHGRDHRVFVLLSDAECFEGSVWEAALFAAGHQLDNLVVIVDDNNFSAMGRTREALGSLLEKWKAFGWEAREVDGHDLGGLRDQLGAVSRQSRPSAIIARTVKGKGVSFMEDDLEWHYRPPSADDVRRALEELEA